MTVHESVAKIYETERDNIYSWLVGLGVAPQRAQELVQDSFLKLYLKMSKGEQIENPRAWLYRVAQNLARRHYSREPAFDELDTDVASPGSSTPETELMERQRRSALLKAVADLSPQQRNCLDLRVRGLRYREIASVIGISTSAVGEFLRRAVVRLKEALDGA